MTTAYAHKMTHDTPEWEPMANMLNANAAAVCFACDLREGADRDPFIYQYASATVLNRYSTLTDEWEALISPAMGTFAAGAGMIYVASAGPAGTLAAGNTSTSVVLSTALNAAVAINQLANRGDGVQGFKIRITGNAAGSAGKTEEKYIIGNSAGTTPTLTLDSALSFTPATGDRYEILSGQLLLFATAATVFKKYDIATNSMIAAPTSTNLTAPAVDFAGIVLDELYTPFGKLPGLGYFGNLTMTANTNTTNATVTGTAAVADASLQANEYTNFQLRIVQDTATPTSVGQRKKITSHTAASPTVYTLSGTFAVQPSQTAVYVIEQVGDAVIYTGSAVALSHTYAVAGWRADGAWSTGVTNGAVAALQIPARQANTAAGQMATPLFAGALDPGKNARYSHAFFVRGGNIATIDQLDIAALSWTADIAYGGKGLTLFTTGSSGAYDSDSNNGKYFYTNVNGGQRFARFDMRNRVLEPWNYYRQVQGAATVGGKLVVIPAVDGSTYGSYVYFMGNTLSTLSRALAVL